MDRFEKLLKAMLAAILGKMENPSVMLEQHYQSLQAELLQLRATLAASSAQAVNLESQIEKKKVKQEDTSALESSLKKLKESIASLKKRLSELEQEVTKTYTKQQVLIARDKASRAANQLLLEQKDVWTLINTMENQVRDSDARKPLPKQFFYWFFALLVVWVLIGIYFGTKNAF